MLGDILSFRILSSQARLVYKDVYEFTHERIRVMKV